MANDPYYFTKFTFAILPLASYTKDAMSHIHTTYTPTTYDQSQSANAKIKHIMLANHTNLAQGISYKKPDMQLRRALGAARVLIIPKGRLSHITLNYLRQLGVRPLAYPSTTESFTVQGTGGREIICTRAASVPNLVKDIPGSVGFTAKHELTESTGPGTTIANQPTALLPRARFAIAAPTGALQDISRKITLHEPVLLCSEYPKTARKIVQRYGLNITIEKVQCGSSEVRARAIDRLDGALVITHTGQTLASNNLHLVLDSLEPIQLTALWNVPSPIQPHTF